MIARPLRKACIAAVVLVLSVPANPQPSTTAPVTSTMNISRLTLSSSVFGDGKIIPPRFTQAVATPVSPPLAWDQPPEATKAFALIMTDMDSAPKRASTGVLHWMLFNIPEANRRLPEGLAANKTFADGMVQGANISGTTGYRGPGAPADGPHHHYSFELYALDIKLDLGPDASRSALLTAMDGHVLAKATLIGKFRK